MPFDAHKNFAYGTVLTAPVPALSGTSIVLRAGDGAKFPAAPFNVTVWPASVGPLAATAEIMRVTAIVGDTLTVSRAQEGSSAVAVAVGYQVAATITTKTFEDIEAMITRGTADPVDPPAATNFCYIRTDTGNLWYALGANWIKLL